MRNPGGYAVIVSPQAQRVNFDRLRCEEISAGTYELDTMTCAHCGVIEHAPIKPGPNDIGFCRYCMKRICQRCCDLPCRPFEKWLEARETGVKQAIERDMALRSYGL